MITWVLVRKLLRDIRVAWIIAAVLLFLFQILWSRITSRITTQIVRDLQAANLPLEFIQNLLLSRNEMIGQLVQAIIGGHPIQLNKSDNFMSISYVHPLVMAILCIWAIGRAANAIAGEIDRGTMELLLAQPIRRSQIIVAHLLVDLLVFPGLCLAMWGGNLLRHLVGGVADVRESLAADRSVPVSACLAVRVRNPVFNQRDDDVGFVAGPIAGQGVGLGDHAELLACFWSTCWGRSGTSSSNGCGL